MEATLPRPDIKVPRSIVPQGVNHDELLDEIIAAAEQVGERFKAQLEISGPNDIWVFADVTGRSNKRSVFGVVYMIPKECRTDEVRHEFGEAMKEAILDVCEKMLGFRPGIDLPIRVVPRLDYIEEDDTH